MIKRHKDYDMRMLAYRIGITITVGKSTSLFSGHIIDESCMHLEDTLIDSCIENLKQMKRHKNYLQKPKHRRKY